MERRVWRLGVAVMAGLLALTASPVPGAAHAAQASKAGTLLSYAKVTASSFAMPGSSAVYSLTYLSRGATGTTPVRATAWLPSGEAPKSGHPVASLGHGTQGVGRSCTLARTLRSDGESFRPYYGPWLRQGFALVATEYAGLGESGAHPYLNVKAAGANMIDAVRALRQLGSRIGVRIDSRYATSGGSQGGHASLSAGTMAASYAPELRLLGTTAVAPPVHIDRYLSLLGPAVPPIPVPDYVTYLMYVLRGISVSRPDLDVARYLTPTGRRLQREVSSYCYREMNTRTQGLSVGSVLAAPLAQGPLMAAIREAQVVPTTGLRRPVLIHQGMADVTAFGPLTELYVAQVRAAGTVVDYHRSLDGHVIGAEAQEQSARWAHRLWLESR
ncbi:MAG: lipase family protein [Gordonia sp. (in: high G+C Gram-positive bacteria)]|uniref:lipase family protein n=1 Tax=Gordonia sp. (in: high G+C Gram-positive bacteria) TaxID=84139 RepID=UPI0039E328F5